MREGLMHMDDLAVKFTKQNRGKGKVTSYCFWWETLPDKNNCIYEKLFYGRGVLNVYFRLAWYLI